jgi:hypothetical protein
LLKMRTRFVLIVGSVSLLSAPVGANGPSFLSTLHHVTTLTSAVPANGDVNPYGVAVVPVTNGSLVANSVLVSNFNNSANLQGTGTTIVQISPAGSLSLFAQIDGANAYTPTHRFYADALYALPFGHNQRFLGHMPRLAEGFLGGWRISTLVTLQTASGLRRISMASILPIPTPSAGGRIASPERLYIPRIRASTTGSTSGLSEYLAARMPTRCATVPPISAGLATQALTSCGPRV